MIPVRVGWGDDDVGFNGALYFKHVCNFHTTNCRKIFDASGIPRSGTSVSVSCD